MLLKILLSFFNMLYSTHTIRKYCKCSVDLLHDTYILMYSRNLFVLDLVRRFFVSCVQIFEAYAVRTLMKFGYDWRKISHKSKCKKDSESTYPFFIKFISLANYTVRFTHSICQPKLLLYSSSS